MSYLLVRLFFLLDTTMATSSLDFLELVPVVDLPDEDEMSSTLAPPLASRAMTESVLSPLWTTARARTPCSGGLEARARGLWARGWAAAACSCCFSCCCFRCRWWWAVAWGAGPVFLEPFRERKPRPKDARLDVLLSLESVRLNCFCKLTNQKKSTTLFSVGVTKIWEIATKVQEK